MGHVLSVERRYLLVHLCHQSMRKFYRLLAFLYRSLVSSLLPFRLVARSFARSLVRSLVIPPSGQVDTLQPVKSSASGNGSPSES